LTFCYLFVQLADTWKDSLKRCPVSKKTEPDWEKSLQFGQENDKKHGKSEGNKPLCSTLNVPVRSEKMMKMGRKWMGADLHKGVICFLCQSERKDLNGTEE